MGDLSGEEGADAKPSEDTGASKYMKKKKSVPVNDSPVKKPKVSDSSPSKTKAIGKMGASAALSKAAAFTSKYAKPVKKDYVLSDSDLDMDLSMDEDVSTWNSFMHISSLIEVNTLIKVLKNTS